MSFWGSANNGHPQEKTSTMRRQMDIVIDLNCNSERIPCPAVAGLQGASIPTRFVLPNKPCWRLCGRSMERLKEQQFLT
jgi:hypothetical protein